MTVDPNRIVKIGTTIPEKLQLKVSQFQRKKFEAGFQTPVDNRILNTKRAMVTSPTPPEAFSVLFITTPPLFVFELTVTGLEPVTPRLEVLYSVPVELYGQKYSRRDLNSYTHTNN